LASDRPGFGEDPTAAPASTGTIPALMATTAGLAAGL